ncbi:mycofactocin biosynthesis glycosyltransferase MftF [Amycolatopsis lurida]
MADKPERFPAGFEVRLRDDVRRLRDGLLLGGSPLRAVRLSQTAQALVAPDGRIRARDATSEMLVARLIDGNLADPVLTGSVDPSLLTVVIPVRDRPDQLGRTLDSLRGVHCVVVDDASVAPAAVADVVAVHGARLLSLPDNLGPAGARNAGLREVRTPYVAFVDSDVVVDPATLLRLARHFADTRVALVGPLVRNRSRAARPRWFERFDEQISSLALGHRACSVRPGAAVAWLPGACLVGRTDLLGDGFAEDMRVGEDVDFVWRLLDRGHLVRYDPAETVHHDARATVHDWLGRKFYYGTGGAALAARHSGRSAPAVMSPTMALAAWAVLTRRPWSVPVIVAALAVATRSVARNLPDAPGRRVLAGRLAAKGLGWAIRQEAALALRHWWPLAALLSLRSHTVRRAVVTSLFVDAVVAHLEHPGARYAPASRRLDDIAYGAGLWAGALRARSIRCLLPRRPRGTPPRKTTAPHT